MSNPVKHDTVDSSANAAGSGASRALPQPHEIERHARSIWEREGRPEGRAVEHWLAAERELSERPAASGDKVSPKNEYKEKAPAGARDSGRTPPEDRAPIVAGPSARSAAVEKRPASSKASAPAKKAGAKSAPDAPAPLVAGKRKARG